LNDELEPEDFKLTCRELALSAGCKLITSFGEHARRRFRVSSITELERFFRQHFTFNLERTWSKAEELDAYLVGEVVNKLIIAIPKMTYALWDVHYEKEKKRQIAATLRKINSNREQEKANSDVIKILDDAAATEEKMKNYVREQVREGIAKEIVKTKRLERKNSSGDSENQESEPASNGRRGRGRSNDSNTNSRKQRGRGRSKQRSGKPKGSQQQQDKSKDKSNDKKNPKSILKKTRFKREATPIPDRKGKGKGNHDASKSRGKGRRGGRN